LAAIREVDSKKTTVGSGYANSTFGFEMALNTGTTTGTGQDLRDMKTEKTPITFPNEETLQNVTPSLSFTIHNANAITTSEDAGKLRVTLNSDDGDTLTIHITIRRAPSQVNVTVPLYVCMYAYGGDGKVVTPSAETYSMINYSSVPVQITSIQGAGSWELKESGTDLKAKEIFLKLADQVVTDTEADISKDSLWQIPAADEGNPAQNVLSIPIQAAIAGGSVNEEGCTQVCTVTYTAGIAE
jgi:hypothetical protein